MYIQLATVRSSIRPFNFNTWSPIRYTFSLANQQIDSINFAGFDTYTGPIGGVLFRSTTPSTGGRAGRKTSSCMERPAYLASSSGLGKKKGDRQR
jgi:hypothetical protein